MRFVKKRERMSKKPRRTTVRRGFCVSDQTTFLIRPFSIRDSVVSFSIRHSLGLNLGLGSRPSRSARIEISSRPHLMLRLELRRRRQGTVSYFLDLPASATLYLESSRVEGSMARNRHRDLPRIANFASCFLPVLKESYRASFWSTSGCNA